MTTTTRIEIPGTFNFRDVGGYATPDGEVRQGVLYRSDGLGALGDAGRAALAEREVGTVIDLRDDFESARSPDDLGGLPIRRISLPLFEGASTSAAVLGADLAGIYERIVLQHTGVVVEAVREIVRTETGAVLVHCTAGKDRTGVIIALVLRAIGVDTESVLSDYAASEANLDGPWLEGVLELISEQGVEVTPRLRVLIGGSPPEEMAALLKLIDTRYGSARDYLLSAGVTVEELALLHARLVRVRQ